jgi:hypothetical protein
VPVRTPAQLGSTQRVAVVGLHPHKDAGGVWAQNAPAPNPAQSWWLVQPQVSVIVPPQRDGPPSTGRMQPPASSRPQTAPKSAQMFSPGSQVALMQT